MPFINLGFTLYSLFWLYSIIGVEVFGGKVSSKLFDRIFKENPDTEINPEYIWLNFNDFGSGLITLQTMMLFNNWQFIWEFFYVSLDNSQVVNWYFLTFMILATYVIINILMAYIIDVYTSIEDAHKNDKEERKVVIDISRAQTQSIRRSHTQELLEVAGKTKNIITNAINRSLNVSFTSDSSPNQRQEITSALLGMSENNIQREDSSSESVNSF